MNAMIISKRGHVGRKVQKANPDARTDKEAFLALPCLLHAKNFIFNSVVGAGEGVFFQWDGGGMGWNGYFILVYFLHRQTPKEMGVKKSEWITYRRQTSSLKSVAGR